MDITITGRKTTVTPALRDYVNEKVGRALEVFESATTDAEVVLRAEKNPANPKSAICEVTVRAKGAIVRVSEAAEDMYAAIDIASDKVERQLRKYKTKCIDSRDRRSSIKDLPVKEEDMPSMDDILTDEDDDLLVRVKEVEMVPMSEEQALVQTDLIGHDFFVYYDKDAKQIQVVYHRKNGGYGIIKPVLEIDD